jgi:hypothetical protein
MSPATDRRAWVWRWARRLLLGAAALMALLILVVICIYCYGDWSGARTWKKARADVEASVISLDPAHYIPPPVPDAENFGALPIFRINSKVVPLGDQKTSALRHALAPIADNFPYAKPEPIDVGKELPWLGRWDRGDTTDLAVIREQLLAFCRHASPPIPVPEDASASQILGLICPVLAELRNENAKRPLCRIECDYSDLTFENFYPITCQIVLAKVLAYDERVALLEGQPQLALDDLEVEWKLVSGLQHVPVLIAGLVTMGVVAIQLDVVREGMAEHAWNDQQLSELDADLGKLDFLAQDGLCLRGEFVVNIVPYTDRMIADRSLYVQRIRAAMAQMRGIDSTIQKAVTVPGGKPAEVHDETGLSGEDSWRLWLYYWFPSNGELNEYRALYARTLLPASSRMIDLQKRLVSPENHDVPKTALSPIFRSVETFARGQVNLDEARIACRLERYRIARGAYPKNLAELATESGGELPHDIMNGAAYHYRLNADGTYVLYSVGWNQKDDGGRTGSVRNADSPDWVWPSFADLPGVK